VSGIESAYAALAQERGLEPHGAFGAGPLTPLLVESGNGALAPALRGALGGNGEGGKVDGVVGQLAFKRNKVFRFQVALAEVGASTAFAPRLFCIRRGRHTRDDEFYGFEARDSKLWTESTALNERYVVSTSPFQDQNRLRQLFCSVEGDDAGPAELAALCEATAHVAARLAHECAEAG
jgi:hypothetical protein